MFLWNHLVSLYILLVDAAIPSAIVWAFATWTRPVFAIMAALWLLGEYTLDCVDAYDICAQQGWPLIEKQNMAFHFISVFYYLVALGGIYWRVRERRREVLRRKSLPYVRY
ncbi:hypothetical protein SI65_02928 [Aspergillus cristatus]|uniref:EXPERA domain-containing protein n=1 Tax=Aspergillus cristatus TaxID=573508 RepID=A0A1E3BM81_ASPCR|nr:hypothetical protein SI65_02928 [Aspergillus cristatus]